MHKALKLLKKASTYRGVRKARVIPDPQVSDVFLVIGKKWAAIVYMSRGDFEEVDVFEANEKYGGYKQI